MWRKSQLGIIVIGNLETCLSLEQEETLTLKNFLQNLNFRERHFFCLFFLLDRMQKPKSVEKITTGNSASQKQMARNFLQIPNFRERHFFPLKKCKGQRVQRKSQLGIIHVQSRWQGTFSRTLIPRKTLFFLDKMQWSKSAEKITIGNNAGQKQMAGNFLQNPDF